ncbi:MAG: hypothetical protein COV07_03850 [Candidatus Vogelbacteria bacterium CG10_big_fil_rev_8_21_14_0_10_45_14]|uniref:Uncharacterized protein n=1 Tax=Candidatus Vogelbacteria bacterium CG10_big_fil_rev_8_21_14_0_10_45_14 TaxID=1975042 RepID=A0A2H0RJ67_9BACT|nr:MAG: hypothetical protein COV07_03850 [Candidatus Vogelbacteria bacterium CG10_big_fil_rev_8_21_14_0_10_45_14]
MSRQLKIAGILLALLLLVVAVFSFGSTGTDFAWSLSGGGTMLLPLVVIAALVDSVNPCAFSVLLLTLAFLFSLGRPRREVLALGGSYLLGLFFAYFAIGLGLLSALHLFDTPHFMGRIGASLLLVLGIWHLVAEYIPTLPKPKIPKVAHDWMGRMMTKASIPAVFVLGALVGLCEFPCTGGPYLMVLGLLHDSGTYLRGILYLVIYNLIFVSPLVLILAMASDSGLLEKMSIWKKDNIKSVRLFGGLLMIILALIILFI